MEGRIQKAREGKWNGGFAPYGYQLVNGKLEINEEEAVAVRTIYDQYVNTDIGSNGISKYLENHGIRKIQRQNGKNPLFDAHLVRLILKNPVYCGKIAYGRRKTEKVHGTRNEALIAEIQIYEERKPNGQWLKSIRFKLPIIENDLSIGLDNGEHVETVALLTRTQP